MAMVSDLDQAVRALADYLVENFSSVEGSAANAQRLSQSFALPENHDLYDFASILRSNLVAAGADGDTSQDVMDAVDALVIAHKHLGNTEDSHGLAIYLPQSNEITADDRELYGNLACNQVRASSWLDVLEKISSGPLPGQMKNAVDFHFISPGITPMSTAIF